MKAQFEMWGLLHYFMIFFPFILAAVLYVLFKKSNEKRQRMVAIILSVLMVLILIARSIYMIDKRNGLNPEAIPFQVCHMANFMMLFASISRKKVIGSIAWCLNFPAAFVSLIFANSLTHYDNILNVQGIAYISGHMLIVTGGLYMVLINIIKVDNKSFVKALKIVGIMYLLSVVINNWFNKIFAHTNTDANYFYSFKPEEGTPLDVFFNLGKNYEILNMTINPIYLILTACIGLIVMVTFYGLYKIKAILA